MTFLTVIAKNLLGRSTRSLLTITGVAIGIAAVVAMTSISRGFMKSGNRIYSAHGTDLVVSKLSSQTPVPPLFEESLGDQFRALPHVEVADPVFVDILSVEDKPMVLFFGWEPGSYLWQHLKLVQGRWPTNDTERAVALGTLAAEMLERKVGDKVQILTGEFTVVGIFESGALLENSALVTTLRQAQEITESKGLIRHISIKLKAGTTEQDLKELYETVRTRFPGLRALSANEFMESNLGIQSARVMSWATSAIALTVGAVGVMNTLLMSVFERVHEIGILLAIGWRRKRIMAMILLESVTLSLLGGIVGIAAGAGFVKLLQMLPRARGFIEGDMSINLTVLAITVALVLGALSGLYPAYRASRLQPSEALRYE